MKVLVIGAGSMGRRRLRDLKYLNPGGVTLFEPAAERCREVSAAFSVPGYTDFEQALEDSPDTLVISTPPALHEPYVRRGIERGLHVFAEVPFIFERDSLALVASGAESYPAVLGISHTIRYYPPFRLIRDLLQQKAIGRPLYLEYSLGNYLPDWHPYEDYRKFYGGDLRLGGAGMDMIFHEIAAVQWWLGPVSSVYARLSKVSSLEINGPDTHDVLLWFASGARGFFHNDVIERGTAGRHIRLAGEEGTIEWHQNQPAVRLYDGRAGTNRELSFSEAADWEEALEASREMAGILAEQKVASGRIPSASNSTFLYDSCYLREMRSFVNAVQGVRPYTMANIGEEVQTVSVFDAIRRSNEQRQEVRV